MQTIQFIPCTEGGVGTSLRSKVKASYADLKEMFGEPAYEGIGDTITTAFVIDYQASDGEGDRKYGTFTLYDWHFARDLSNDYNPTTWNVGGNSFDDGCAADLALDIFKETNDSLVYAKLHKVDKDQEFFL